MTTAHGIEPYIHGLMDVGAGHQIYWECHGNPTGRPAVYFHGGPGSGFSRWIPQLFDLHTYRVLLFDQRGCGRSRPLANTAAADLRANTTHHLIADVERLRVHLGIEQWTILGLSWGTTLGLAYAQLHPQRVAAAVFGLVTTTSSREVAWITEGVGRIFPREWERFAAAVPEYLRSRPLVAPTLNCSSTPIRKSWHAQPKSGAHGKTPTSRSLPVINQTPATRIPHSACSLPGSSPTTGATLPSSRPTSYCAMHTS